MLTKYLFSVRSLSLLLAMTNSMLGVSLGFFYGAINIKTVIVGICTVFASISIQALCNYSIDYSVAYRNHRKDKQNGIVTPIIVRDITVTELRHRMAIITVFASITGTIAMYLSFSDSIQLLSWFLFFSVISVLGTMLYASSSLYLYKGIGAMIIFGTLGFFSIIAPQFLIISASGTGLDIYPDTLGLAFSATAISLLTLYIRNLKSKTVVRKYTRKSLRQLFGYEMSSLYIISLYLGSVLLSVLACATSHRLLYSMFLLTGYIPVTYYVYLLIRNPSHINLMRIRLIQMLFFFNVNNCVWIGILASDYWVYN